MKSSDFSQVVKIDPEALDLAAATQAEVFYQWAERAIRARSRVDQLKTGLELLVSRIGLECRASPLKFGLAKATESAVDEVIKSHGEYSTANANLLSAREDSLLADAAVQALEQRKRMIEILVTLHGQQYFAGPSVPRDLVSAWRELQDDRSDNLVRRQAARARRVQRTGE